MTDERETDFVALAFPNEWLGAKGVIRELHDMPVRVADLWHDDKARLSWRAFKVPRLFAEAFLATARERDEQLSQLQAMSRLAYQATYELTECELTDQCRQDIVKNRSYP